MATRNYGWHPQPNDERDYKFTLTTNVNVLPKTVDLRSKMSEVYDQQSLGSCTGNGVASIVQHLDLNFMPSRLFIYYNERLLENTIMEDAGANIRDGIKTINQYGVCSENDWIYDIKKFTEKPSDKCYLEAQKKVSLSYYAVNQLEQDLKTALSQGFPIVFGFLVKASFENNVTATTGIYKPSGKIVGGHCIVIVGYDDVKKSFLMRNSWGKNWGLNGHFWMPYREVLNNKISSDFWVISKMNS